MKGFWLLKRAGRESCSFALAGSVSNAWNRGSHLATNLRMKSAPSEPWSHPAQEPTAMGSLWCEIYNTHYYSEQVGLFH